MKHLQSIIVLFICFGQVLQADDVRDVLIVVGPSTHPPGSHEVVAGGRVMKYCLEHAPNLPKVKVDLVEGWPSNAQRDAAETVVFIGDTFPANRLPNVQQNLADLNVMIARGCGIVCVHYATGLRGEDVSPAGDHPLLRWLGGYFANRTCPHHESFAKIFPKATITPAAPQHPISHGWREFTLHDEPYYNNYFGPGSAIAPNVTVLATSMLPPDSPRQETVAWCIERTDGGRGFGIVMPHFYKNWQEEDLRRLILNGIAWSAKVDVPAEGVQTTLPNLAEFSPASVEFRPDLAPLVRRIVAAAGGKANLLSRFTIHEKLNVSDDPEAPGKPRESVFDGRHEWWYRSGKGAWKKKQNEPAADLVWAWTLQALVDQHSKLEVLAEINEDGQSLVGLRISNSIQPAMDLYFDKQTHQLARIDWRNDINRFSDWKEHDGAKYPARCVGTRKSTGKTWFVSEISELRRIETLPNELTQ